MGIDVRMLIRNVPRKMVTDEWLKEMSWRLCTAIGAEHFMIRDGLSHIEYQKAYAGWAAAWKAHALHARYEEVCNTLSPLCAPDSAREELQRLTTDIVADVGVRPTEMCLAIDRTLAWHRESCDPEPGSEYHEDSDKPIKAREGECLIEVNLAGRYYGEGYERGDILTYCAIAEWLETNIPACESWYGGDSSGVLAERFDDERRKSLRRHLYSTEGRAYFNRNWPLSQDEGLQPPACGLCPRRGYLGSQFGTGNGGVYAAFHCSGCGHSVETQDGGKTWAPRQRDAA